MRLKTIFLFCGIFLFFLSNKDIRQIFADETKPDKTLSFTFNRFYLKDSIKFVECTLSNNTDTTFWILGYDTLQYQKKTYIRAIYSMQIKKDGKWRDSDLGFSGMGIDRFALKPGEKLFFETPDFDSTAEAFTIGIDMRIRSGDDKLRIVREIRTDEIKLR